MKTSETIKGISGAVMELQGRIPYVGKDSEGYGYRYTSLPAFNQKVYPEMRKLGLSISCCPDHLDGEPAITTLLVHVPTGEFYEATFPMSKAGIGKANDAQQMGAAITYMCRYCPKAIMGIASDDDDAECLTEDANETGPEKPALPKPPTNGDIATADPKKLSRAQLKKRMKGTNTLEINIFDKMFELEKDMWTKSWEDSDQEGLASIVASVENRIAKEG